MGTFVAAGVAGLLLYLLVSPHGLFAASITSVTNAAAGSIPRYGKFEAAVAITTGAPF